MSASALGVRYEGDALPGLVPGASASLPAVQVELAPQEALDERWAPRAARSLVDDRYPDGSLFLAVEHDDEAGYRIHAPGYGTHLISADAARLSTTPAAATWGGRRLLVGQVLPLLSVLHGREVLHAGGALVDERLVGFVAASGTGKSSTIGQLVAAGARFFADDVLALERAGGELRAHPGPRLLNLDAQEVASLDPAAARRLGPLVAEDEELHFEPEGATGPAPLAGLLFLKRAPDAVTAIAPSVRTAEVLGAAYLAYLQTPERLVGQLETTAVLSRRVTLGELTIGTGDGSGAIAAKIAAWTRGLA